MAQSSWDFSSGAREEKRREDKRREAREEKIRESREERTREVGKPTDSRESMSRVSSRESFRDPIDDKLRKFSEKPSKSPRSSAALSSTLPDRGAPFQRLVCFLTALPLGLALFAFLLLDPPLDPASSGLGLSSSLGGNSTSDLQSTQPGCSRAVKKEFLFPARPWHSSLQPLGYPRVSPVATSFACSTAPAAWDGSTYPHKKHKSRYVQESMAWSPCTFLCHAMSRLRWRLSQQQRLG